MSAKGNGKNYPRGRGARGGRGQGRGSAFGRVYPDADKRNEWEKLEKITIGTNLRTLRKACIANCKENWKKMMSVMENGQYVIMDRPTKERTVANLNAYAQGDFFDAMGLENVIFRADAERIPDSDDESSDDEDGTVVSGPKLGGAARRAPITATGAAVAPDETTGAAGAPDEDNGAAGAPNGENVRAAEAPDDDAEVHGYTKKQINKLLDAELIEWMKFLRQFGEDKAGAYRDLWDKCNEDVKAVCKTKSGFRKMEKLQDFRELYFMLHVVLSGGGFADPDDIREKIEDEWRQLKMFSKEVLDVFKERFDIAVMKLRCIGIEKTEEELATSFIRKLDDERFAELQRVQKRSGTHMGALYSEKILTLDHAYAVAQSETVVRGSETKEKTATRYESGNRYGAAFVGRGARGSRGRGGRGRGTEKEKVKSAEKTTEARAGAEAPVTCYKCNGEGHRKSECPSNDTSEVECWNCRGVGHYANECTSPAKKQSGEKA
jgi:hypothetical protein